MKPTYTIDEAAQKMVVTFDGCDEIKALGVCHLAQSAYRSWEENEYTEWSDFDELVAGATAALGMEEVCQTYRDMVDEGTVTCLETNFEDLPEASAMRGCAAILSAQYANEVNADVGVVNELIHDECLPVAGEMPAPGV